MRKQMPKLRKISLKKALGEIVSNGIVKDISYKTASNIKKELEKMGIDSRIEIDLDFFAGYNVDSESQFKFRAKFEPSILIVD